MNRIEEYIPQAIRPYEDPAERLGCSATSTTLGRQPKSERNTTHLRRYILREIGRNRVDLSGVTGRSKIGRPTTA